MKSVVMLGGHQKVMEGSRSSENSDAEMKHDEHVGHGPGMVRDFLRRLIVSIMLSIPIVLFPPLGDSSACRVCRPSVFRRAFSDFYLLLLSCGGEDCRSFRPRGGHLGVAKPT